MRNHELLYHPISLPSDQYGWDLLYDGGERGIIASDGMFYSKDLEGFVGIIVQDQSIANNTAESSVKIVFPNLLDIDIVDVSD